MTAMVFSDKKLFEDFCTFCQLQRETHDIDPVYPLLNHLYQDFSHERALWHTVLYVAYYHLGSATKTFSTTLPCTSLSQEQCLYPCATERRGFRGGAIKKHIDSICEVVAPYGSLERFFANELLDNPLDNWVRLTALLTRFWGNGRWAAYKTCEILMTTHHYPLEAPDMGNEFSTGPRKGLLLFYPEVKGNKKEVIAHLDQQGDHLLHRLHRHGIFLHIAQLETMLCDFHALFEGHYYVGHDIDQMQKQLMILDPEEASPLFCLRARTFPSAYLGEMHGWCGPDNERKKVYQETGVIATR